jgi:hypothetical protein
MLQSYKGVLMVPRTPENQATRSWLGAVGCREQALWTKVATVMPRALEMRTAKRQARRSAKVIVLSEDELTWFGPQKRKRRCPCTQRSLLGRSRSLRRRSWRASTGLEVTYTLGVPCYVVHCKLAQTHSAAEDRHYARQVQAFSYEVCRPGQEEEVADV